MTNPELLKHLRSYTEKAHDLPAILVAAGDLGQLFEGIKLFIQNSINHNEIRNAEQAVQFAWAIAHHTKDHEHEALAHWCSLIFFNDRDIKQALHHADSAKTYYAQTTQTEKEGRILIGYASQLNLLGRLDEAEGAIHRSIACLANTPDYRDWPIVYINLAYIQIQQGRYTDALVSAQRAVAIATQFGTQKPDQLSRYQWMRAQALVNQGLAELFLGHHDAAISVVYQALSVAKSYGFSNVAGRAALNLARLAIIKGELFTALQVLRSAGQEFERAQGETNRGTYTIEEAYLYIEEAHLYQRLAMIRRACQSAARAATAFAQAGLPAGSLEATLLVVRLSLILGETGKAYTHLTAAQEYLQAAPPVHQELWHAYQAHPAFQKNREQRQGALQAAEQRVTALQKLEARSEWLDAALLASQLAIELDRPDARQRLEEIAGQARQAHLNAIEQEACSKVARYQPQKIAIQTLQRAVDILKHVRTQMPVEELKANLLTGHSGLYTQLIEAQLKNHRPVEAATMLLEAKGGLWADLINPIQRQTSANVWAELMFWRDELRAATEVEYRTLCQTKIQTAEFAIAETASQPAQQREAMSTPTPVLIQDTLDSQTVVVEYLIGTTHIWACLMLAAQPPQWFRLCKHTVLQPLLERFALLIASIQHCPTVQQRHATAQAQQPWMKALLSKLHHYLIVPFAGCLPVSGTLVIVPDRYLFEIPWTALADEYGYLSERYVILLAPSAAVLAIKLLSAPGVASVANGRPRALGYAGEPPLTFVAPELSAIQHAFPNILIANPATAADLTWDVAPRFLHISAHGRIQRNAPLLSSLELADGPFLLADVLKLKLYGTQFVTLSACETGTTPEQGGVLLALAGAFLCAGAQSVLASLWSVDDEATQILMSTFYASLQNNHTPAQALHHAQQAVRSASFAHPFYWAAFQPLSRVI